MTTRAMRLVGLADVRAGAARVAGLVRRTPVVRCDPVAGIPDGTTLLAKAENLQETGSFKVRGAANALLARRERGEDLRSVVTFSAGNHGAAVAFVGRRLGLDVTVCMPPNAARVKVEAVRRHGGRVVFATDLVGAAAELAEKRQATIVHPFEDLDVIAGQGSTGLEILDDVPNPDALIVPVGGGGLISGLGSVFSALSADTKVIAVEPARAAALGHAWRVGAPEQLPWPPQSIADGLTAPSVGPLTYAHTRRFVHQVVEVTEQEIREAWTGLVSAGRLFVEPSGAVALAALRTGRLDLPADPVVVLVATGGNSTIEALAMAEAS